MKLKVKYSILLLSLPLPLLVIVYLLYPRPEQIIFGKNNESIIEVYTDINTGGNSKGTIIKKESSLSFNYTVGDQLQFPYTGFRIYNQDSSTFNFIPFNEVKISIKAKKARHIPLHFIIKDYPLKNGETTMILFHSQLDYHPTQLTYTIPFSEFEIPTWWFAVNHLDEDNIDEIDFANVSCFEVQCGELVKPNEQDNIELYAVSFHQNPTALFLKVGIYLLVFNLLGFVVFLFRLKYRVQIIPVPYQSQEVENLAENDLARIQHFVSQNYHKPITTQSVQLETGIPKSKIPTILKQELNTSLKQLLTSIRLNEAKRLLKTSDLPVNEIADQVGFGNVSHFNRVFKEFEKMTPLEYRKL